MNDCPRQNPAYRPAPSPSATPDRLDGGWRFGLEYCRRRPNWGRLASSDPFSGRAGPNGPGGTWVSRDLDRGRSPPPRVGRICDSLNLRRPSLAASGATSPRSRVLLHLATTPLPAISPRAGRLLSSGCRVLTPRISRFPPTPGQRRARRYRDTDLRHLSRALLRTNPPWRSETAGTHPIIVLWEFRCGSRPIGGGQS